ncbi:HD-GYP domain-containing protein (c-di-GMP phosphodiesterase class II) [Paenibacillus forsythiae]|uniref:HD-GYP domain-containing protein (C-di-GMP phosphodiesterase class II) n=1 Tax=Paenibacillus forsythiae TaxID=365616 RepID=A0ABU3H3C2_9BACL|nr:HD-GYP domain-containing protein [Paenibacillus forsythiae]MDT3425211.1 HD-GYP domain-containing protein (c-di-GMP phosphodiesterase class II) [Paenibacillus forsythiae]
MTSISVAEVKPGSKVSKDVITPLGGVLFVKGTILLPRDMEILEAFLIQQVDIEGSEEEVQALEQAKAPSITAAKSGAVITAAALARSGSELHEEYDKMLALIKKCYSLADAEVLPIYELRSCLEAMIAHIKDYHVLNYSPRTLSEQDYIYHNAVLSALTSYKIAQWCGYPQKEWLQVAFAGLLHDIGNAKIDSSIMQKPQPLTMTERNEVRKHTTYGYQILRKVTAINEGVRLAALQHHEKIDGSGYPLRLRGSQIHIYAKIVAVADIFHAMTLERIYKKAQSPYLVLEEIQKEGFGQLEPSIVQTFIHKTTELHNGTKVRLNDGRQGEIIFSDRSNPTRPLVNVEGKMINLAHSRQLYIQEILT